jgi:hypothetical protein
VGGGPKIVKKGNERKRIKKTFEVSARYFFLVFRNQTRRIGTYLKKIRKTKDIY